LASGSTPWYAELTSDCGCYERLPMFTQESNLALNLIDETSDSCIKGSQT
jgi:hypothetical protein